MKSVNILKNKILIFLAIILAFFVYLSPIVQASALDDSFNSMKTTAGESYGGKGGTVDSSGVFQDMPTAIGQILGYLLSFLGIIFFVLIIYAGFEWMTAAGNEEQTKKARSLINAAIVGLIIVLAAFAFTSFFGNMLLLKLP
jgi:hypothetical protein